MLISQLPAAISRSFRPTAWLKPGAASFLGTPAHCYLLSRQSELLATIPGDVDVYLNDPSDSLSSHLLDFLLLFSFPACRLFHQLPRSQSWTLPSPELSAGQQKRHRYKEQQRDTDIKNRFLGRRRGQDDLRE